MTQINIKELATAYIETPRIPKGMFLPTYEAIIKTAIKEAFIQGANTIAIALQIEAEKLYNLKKENDEAPLSE